MKAILVETTFISRIIVPDDTDLDNPSEWLIGRVQRDIQFRMMNEETVSAIAKITDDKECPLGSLDIDYSS